MRYQVRVIDRPDPIVVEAGEFVVTGQNGGITFYSDRMRNAGGADQWGNPHRLRQRVSVAYFGNVVSIVELPDEVPEATIGGLAAQATPFVSRALGDIPPFAQHHQWLNDGPGLGGRLNGHVAAEPPIGVDDDGVNWDAARDE